jgi:glycosyltransferase involved in cell wall biosynthesis
MMSSEESLRVLVIAPRIPRPDVASGDRRLFGLLELLAKDHEVYFWSASRIGGEQRTAADYQQMLKAIKVRVLPRWGGDIHLVLAWRAYDAVVCEFWHCAEAAAKLVRRFQPWAYLVTDSVDVHFIREEAGLSFGVGSPQEVQDSKGRELAVYRASDAVIVVTEEDGQALRAAGGIRRAVVVPNLISLRSRRAIVCGQELLFVGGFWHLPNVDSILWFVKEIFPYIREEMPAAKLTIVGSNAPPEIKRLGGQPGIEFVGYVNDTGPCLDRAAVSIAPLRFGGGMKGKVTEAMSAGLPIVTTTFGAQGLPIVHGKHLLIADTPQHFAASVVSLLKDQRMALQMGADAQQLIQGICGPEAVSRRLDTLFCEEYVRKAPPSAHRRLFLLRPWCFLVGSARALLLATWRFFRSVSKHLAGSQG